VQFARGATGTRVGVLPSRCEVLARLRAQGHQFALLAQAHLVPKPVHRSLDEACAALALPAVCPVALISPRQPARDWIVRLQDHWLGPTCRGALVVGASEVVHHAALAARVPFRWAWRFFDEQDG